MDTGRTNEAPRTTAAYYTDLKSALARLLPSCRKQRVEERLPRDDALTMRLRLAPQIGDGVRMPRRDVTPLAGILGEIEQQRRRVLRARLAFAVRVARDEVRLVAPLPDRAQFVVPVIEVQLTRTDA